MAIKYQDEVPNLSSDIKNVDDTSMKLELMTRTCKTHVSGDLEVSFVYYVSITYIINIIIRYEVFNFVDGT